ncbi:MAG: hypothetical protein RLZZ324_1034 [Candidatus Parcubacteria bacterium]
MLRRFFKRFAQSRTKESPIQGEDQRQKVMYLLFTFILIPYDGWYGLAYAKFWAYPVYRIPAVVLCSASVILFLNFIAYLFHKRTIAAKQLVTITALFVNFSIIQTGGIENTSIYWLAIVPALIFLFQGIKLGTMYNVIFLGGIIGLRVAQAKGLYQSVYTLVQFDQELSLVVCAVLLGYAAESGWDKSRRIVVQQHERLKVLLQNLPAGVIMTDDTGHVVSSNESAALLFGQPVPENASIRSFPEKFGLTLENGAPYPVSEMPTVVAIEKNLGSMKSDIFLHDKEGGERVLRVAGAPVHSQDGKVTGAVSVMTDITKEHEIDKMKSEFVSFASHQLKTPLTAIKWSLESLVGGDSGKLNATQEENAKEIDSEVQGLQRLVSDLLNVSRIETGRNFSITPAATNLRPIVEKAAHDVAAAAAKRNVSISLAGLPTPFMRLADADKIKEVILNLMSNAVKYSKDGGHVEVGAKSTSRGEALYVKDDGVGIPKAQQARVFERFFRAANVADAFEGTGLGLYIVREIVTRHGGGIWFESEEGKGTTFYLTLPKSA